MKILFTILLLLTTSQAAFGFELVAALPHRNANTLEKKFWEIATPTSKNYLKFLSIKEVRELVGSDESSKNYSAFGRFPRCLEKAGM